MGTFRTELRIANLVDRTREVTVGEALVVSGSEYTWVPGSLLDAIGVSREKKDVSFTMANGQMVTRTIGYAIVRSGKFETVDEVVFGEPGDLSLLGARSLEGFNAKVDSHRKQLVAAGPVVAAGNVKTWKH